MKANEVRQAPFYRRFPPAIHMALLEPRCCISESPRFIFFRIPKAANSTLIASIFHAVHGHLEVGQEELNRYKNSFRRPSSLDDEAVHNLLVKYTCFAIVRNPYTRFVSAYLEKIVAGRAEKIKVAKALGRDVREPISLDEFANYVEHLGASRWMRIGLGNRT